MNEGPNTLLPKQRFSIAWAVGAGLFHFVATFVLADLYSQAYKASFVEDTSFEMAIWRAVLWLWTPLAMAAGGLEGADAGLLIGLVSGWACIIAAFVGFSAPHVGGWLRKRFYPSTTLDDCTRNARPNRVIKIIRWLFPFGVKRKTGILIACALIVLEMTCGGWFFYRAFRARHRSFTIRDFIRFRPISQGIRHAPSFTLYEGLPHQLDEATKLAEELATKATFRIHHFPFYERPLPITPKDVETLRQLTASADTFWSYGGPKLCGGFHPDYCLAWGEDSTTYNLLLCFGCHEMLFSDTKRVLVADIREEALSQFKAILRKYHKQRPISR